jgi:endo-1,4-beta-xylanase
LVSRKRVTLIAVVATVVTGVALPAVVMTTANAASTLAQLAEATGRYFGSATDNPELTDTPYVNTLTGGEFDELVPGNSMKWQFTEPSQGSFQFAGGDAVVALGQQHNMKVRGHTLVWHSQLPGWVSSLPLNQVQAAMENHITREATQYRGKVFAWDVVNEPFNEDGSFRQDVFFNAFGGGMAYIADALRTTRAADPTVKLYLNDFNIEGAGLKSDAMFNLASQLKQQGVPLDGIGFQAHLATQVPFPTNMQQNLQRFANLGLDVSITELDVRMPLPETTAQDNAQITYYTNVVKACLAVSRCVGMTLWDYTDKYSWVPSTFSGQGAATPWDMSIVKKPALYNAISTALGGTASSPPSSPASSTSSSRPPSSRPPSSPPASSSTTTSSPPPVTGACTVTYRLVNSWQGGFQVEDTIRAGNAPITAWTARWTLASGQGIQQLWNGALTPNGSVATVKNLNYNGNLAPSASTTFGFTANSSGPVTAPTVTCTPS